MPFGLSRGPSTEYPPRARLHAESTFDLDRHRELRAKIQQSPHSRTNPGDGF
jgi:hypothetical protein